VFRISLLLVRITPDLFSALSLLARSTADLKVGPTGGMVSRVRYRLPMAHGRVLDLGARTLIMGILNVTPDSFADGGRHFDFDRAVAAGLRMIAEGADIIDVGGESTRPGADPLPEDEELRRVLPVVERLASETDAPISIDTYKANVARAAVARGASIINDVSGLQYEPALGTVASETGAALILMHTRGRSRSMYELAVYDDVVGEVTRELSSAIDRATGAGVARERIVIDPGFGFAKRAEHSYEVLARLDALAALDRPILSGPSRKSFLKAALGEREPDQREWGTAAAVTISVLLGAHIVRVHGVDAMVDVVRVADRIRDATSAYAT
jgi:dihydropteroate synthase